jgi:hypothetical protein
MAGCVPADSLRLLLGELGKVSVLQPSTGQRYPEGEHVSSSMMVLPDDGQFYLLSMEDLRGNRELRADAYSLSVELGDAAASTVEALLERPALVFVTDAAAAPGSLEGEKERFHDLLGSMGGRPPLAAVIALNSDAAGTEGDGGIEKRLGLDELKCGGALVQLFHMAGGSFPDHGVMAESVNWVCSQLAES